MVVKIIESVQIDNINYIAGQEYKHLNTVMLFKSTSLCGHTEVSETLPEQSQELQITKVRGYEIEVDSVSQLIPAEHAALIKKDEPDPDCVNGYMDQYVRRATDDYVVKDGDYTKAVKDRLGISIAPKPRADQADYDQKRIREALNYNKNLLNQRV